MVLQRDRPIHVWGWSEPGERVTASMTGATQSGVGDRLGHWSLYLPPQPAGRPLQLTVEGSNKIVLDDILMGDVWFASGQSNMEMPLNGFPGSAVLKNGGEEIRRANQPKIRLLFIPHKTSVFPLPDFDMTEGWTECSPQTAAKFSAVAYFFGRDLAQKEQVPIGLIDSTWGGTPAEAWVSLDSLSSDAALMPVFAARAQMIDEQAGILAVTAAEKRQDEAARGAHTPLPQHPWRPDPASWDPSWLFNGMVAPAVEFGIKGVIWYQGESNSARSRAPLYQKLFPALITDWRKQWNQGDFPFLFVQISSYSAGPADSWPIVREAQRRTLAVANTAMAVTIDVGERNNIHPADKQTVGARLALAARSLAYGETVEYSGPAFRQVSTEASGVRVWFDHASGGLQAKGGSLQGFQIAGVDRKFVNAEARIEGASVLVTNSAVATPKYVRYGWENAPPASLFNSEGLPASPFTSEKEIPEP